MAHDFDFRNLARAVLEPTGTAANEPGEPSANGTRCPTRVLPPPRILRRQFPFLWSRSFAASRDVHPSDSAISRRSYTSFGERVNRKRSWARS